MTFSTQNPAQVMQVLSDTTNQHICIFINHIANRNEAFDKKSKTNSPLSDSFYNERDKDTIKSIINFKPVEFNKNSNGCERISSA